MSRRVTTILFVLACAGVVVPAALAQEDPGGGQAPTPRPTPPPPPPPPTPRLDVERPGKRVLIRAGQSRRYMLGGTWYFRQDDRFVGDRRRFFRQRSLRGWRRVSVPHNWNAADTTLNRSSVGWYRHEFRLPGSPRLSQWKLRFESVNHRATVFLNGRRIGAHAPGYFPFDVELRGLRRGRNRLVVKVSSLRANTDLTHWRAASFNGYGTGGWWNFGGISREVYLRKIDRVDIERVRVTPRVGRRGNAKVRVRVRVRNMTRVPRGAQVAVQVGRRRGRRIGIGTARLGPRGVREVGRTFTIRRARLWQPGRPTLYRLRATAASEGRRRSTYRLSFGLKRIRRTSDGRLLLNGRKLNVRGASIHEDDPERGTALRSDDRKEFLTRLRQLNATVTRAHYPMHPAQLEAFDRAGILVWSQAPVYQVPVRNMSQPKVRRNAVRVVRETILRDEHHPSILVWSIGNELPEEASGAQQRYIADAARQVRRLDPSRPVALDRRSQLGQRDPVPAILKHVQVLGVNGYFGWYSSSLIPNRVSRVADFGPFLDNLHRVYPGKPMVITEFGAEANRSGSAGQKGTFQFQASWLRQKLAIFAPRPFVNGAIVWALRDFRVTPTWGGGNPQPSPPWNNKGLIEESGAPKPAFTVMKGLFGATPQHR